MTARRPPTSRTRLRIRIAALAGAVAALLVPSLAVAFGIEPFPIASMTTSDRAGLAPLTVSFDASSSYGVEGSIPTTYTWDFGDGSTGSGVTTSHTYTTSGSFIATLTVTDQFGTAGTASTLVTAFVRPTVTVTATPTSGFAPLAVAFDAQATLGNGRTLRSVTWDFGDGVVETTTSLTAAHTYTTLGLHYATVSITDDAGWGSTAVQPIAVTAPMAPPTNLRASSPRRSTAVLTWSNRMPDAAVNSMEVQRCAGSKCTNFVTVNYLPAGATTYSEVVARGPYRYRIKVIDVAGTTGSSNVASVSVR